MLQFALGAPLLLLFFFVTFVIGSSPLALVYAFSRREVNARRRWSGNILQDGEMTRCEVRIDAHIDRLNYSDGGRLHPLILTSFLEALAQVVSIFINFN